MHALHIDAEPRATRRAHSRRGALGRAAAVIVSIAAPNAAHARKAPRRRRCRNGRRDRVPTCEEHCFPDFPLCYTRTAGPPLCANGAFEDGETPCTSDQDCLGDPAKPYCLVSVTARETGSASRFTTCEPYGAGCCISVGIFS
jgi:hypothetical protein